jgi:hypothetical protein
MAVTSGAARGFVSRLGGDELLIRLDWSTFVGIAAPYPAADIRSEEVTARYSWNGYDWDIHGTLFIPTVEAQPYSFVLIHGGGVNELDFHRTPDGRPGLALVLASQGFRVLTPSYPGLWPPGGKWRHPVAQRKPYYLLDRAVPEEELLDRLLKATYQVYMRGIGLLTERSLGGRRLFVHGHSTGGPMATSLTQYVPTAQVVGILGWGSGGPDGWLLRWRQETQPQGGYRGGRGGLTDIHYRTVEEYRDASGYEDDPDLTPWGRMEERFQLTQETTPTFNPPLQNAQHLGSPETLEEYRRRTGLPREEYFAHFDEPDPGFLRRVKALLLVGERDRFHWVLGDRLEEKQEYYVARLYAQRAGGAHLVVVPRYTHMGHWARHNEKLAYLWLWAIKSGYFGSLT